MIKKDDYNKWYLSGEEQDREQYKVEKMNPKKDVPIARENVYGDLYQTLDLLEGRYII